MIIMCLIIIIQCCVKLSADPHPLSVTLCSRFTFRFQLTPSTFWTLRRHWFLTSIINVGLGFRFIIKTCYQSTQYSMINALLDNKIRMQNSRADPGFSWRGGGGGGAQKVMCPHAHYERGTELTFGQGPGPSAEPWKLQCCFNALSCYLSHILSILIKEMIKKIWLIKVQGGRLLCTPPPFGSATGISSSDKNNYQYTQNFKLCKSSKPMECINTKHTRGKMHVAEYSFSFITLVRKLNE